MAVQCLLWAHRPRLEQNLMAGNKSSWPCPVLRVFQDYCNLCVPAAFSQHGLWVQRRRLQPFSVIYVRNSGVIRRA